MWTFYFYRLRLYQFLTSDMRRHLVRLILIINFESLLYFERVVLESMTLQDQEPMDGINNIFIFFLNLADFMI